MRFLVCIGLGRAVSASFTMFLLVSCGGGGVSDVAQPAPIAQQTNQEPVILAGAVDQFGYVDAVGSAARFSGAGAIALDEADNVYEGVGRVIRKVTPDGAVSTFAGSPTEQSVRDGRGTDARFVSITGLSFDRSRQVLVLLDLPALPSPPWRVVREVTLDGSVSTRQGLSTQGLGDRSAFAPDGTIYVAGGGQQQQLGGANATAVYRVRSGSEAVLLAGDPRTPGFRDGAASGALFLNIQAMAADGSGNVFVADNGAIRKIAADGTVTTVAGVQVTPLGASSADAVDGQGSTARFFSVSALALEPDGSLLAADRGLIRRITPGGKVTTIARSATTVYQVLGGLAFDSIGRLYVSAMSYIGRFDRFVGP